MVQINWTLQAVSDLEDIANYIAKDSKKYAKLQIIRIKSRTKILATQAYAGKIVPEINQTDIRELVEGNYRIIYKIIDLNNIVILTIHHSSRDLGLRVII